MPVIGITGGVATGKSLFVRALREAAPGELFDADATVHTLLESDEKVRTAVCAAFGSAVGRADESIDRARLRELVFRDEQARHRLEAILHPLVRDAWMKQAEYFRSRNALLYADIPLLYETHSEPHFDRVIVVTCSPQTQRERMRTQRGLAKELIERIIATQLDLAVKVARADHLIWNNSTMAILEEQARVFAAWLRQRYG